MSSVYGVFDLSLKERIMISPSILRCVFNGPEVHQMQRYAPDQRIKLLLPLANSIELKLNSEGDWYRDYMAIPKEQRPLMRTYTIRALRVEQQEMDVEFVLHGKNSPVSNWLSQAKVGDPLQVIAPKGEHQDCFDGCEWKPSPQVCHSLLIADEAALPAALGILEQLAQYDDPPYVQAFFEVPIVEDCINVEHFTFADIFWLPRDEGDKHAYGERLVEAVRQYATIPDSATTQMQSLVEEVSPEERLWERANNENSAQSFYAWVAAESSTVKKLRHYLTLERYLDRTTVNFMAYWSKSSSRGNQA
ncbi:siderophore-interacting protein [Xenorhabdus hominickii]|uniref:NADPH-dependent ferric siderophore reductase n=1 Tax=Xenorhabdus hominickii TaxID=351679 RepID=A0A2G0QAG6_XENHO|nr:siderophore-interacting protein [Xenorhabdus hominickii]AOM40884.1 NADPH-dependent ferric siderophore reductase [Xenorhabdus hominickii]PHM56149.1 vibriobactin utilization protein ViuB [Xenorhabdus hominickii]